MILLEHQQDCETQPKMARHEDNNMGEGLHHSQGHKKSNSRPGIPYPRLKQCGIRKGMKNIIGDGETRKGVKVKGWTKRGKLGKKNSSLNELKEEIY